MNSTASPAHMSTRQDPSYGASPTRGELPLQEPELAYVAYLVASDLSRAWDESRRVTREQAVQVRDGLLRALPDEVRARITRATARAA